MTITTNRLTMRPFAAVDERELLAVFRDPDVRRYLLDDSIVTPEWVAEEIAASERRFSAGSLGLWSIRLTGSPPIVGFAGFREFFDPPQLQLLYGLLRSHWQRGLATEAAAAVCDYAFRTTAMTEITAATDVPNAASIAVLRRLGMRETHRAKYGRAGTVFFAVDREGFSGASSPPRGRFGVVSQ